MQTIVVVIPAYNEAKVLPQVLQELEAVALTSQAHIIPLVLDDGSRDETAQIAQDLGVLVVRHAVNRGLGAALSTGITAAHSMIKKLGVEDSSAIVTLDADGQHDPMEIFSIVQPILDQKAEVVIGSRFLQKDNDQMPWHRTIANRLANMLTGFLFGIWVSDTQSGYRAFSYIAATQLQIRTSTMEVSSEIIREIGRNKWRLVQVPVTVAYTEYSLSKGQSFTKGLETLWKLIVLKFMR